MDPGVAKRLGEIEARLEERSFPPQIVIETTAHCNFRCVHCNHKEMQRPKNSMSERLFRKIVDEIVAENPDTEVWPTFYGEAFILGDRLFEWLQYARDRGARNLVLNSNGSLLWRKDWIDQILTSGLRRFILSLDGFTAETFERIRVGGKRDAIYRDVERLLDRRRELGLHYPVIQCQFSVMQQNQHELPAFKAFWEARGAEVKSRNMLSWSNSGTVTAPNLDYQSGFRIACPWGNNTLAIHHNGDVVACAVDYEARFVAGNVNQATIRDIWTGPLRTRLREPHRAHDWERVPKICQDCPDWQAVGAVYYAEEDAADPTARPFWWNQSGGE